jgi:hypothetical protein
MLRKLSALLLVPMLLLTVSANAKNNNKAEFKKWIKAYEAKHFQQDSYKPVDPKADAVLIRKLDQVPMKLLQALVKSSYPQAEIEKEKQLKQLEEANKKKLGYKIGKTVPIDVDRLINKCRKIMLQYYPNIKPTLGQEHKWSPEAKKYLIYGFWHRLGRSAFRKQKEFPSPLFFRSKLFLLLACGWTSRYAFTGQEEALKKRIMLYPDRKMQLHHMFMESYVLNKGNIYLTFLTAENVLAGDPYRADRENDPVQKKLAYIRHDSVDMGDNYGAWYHFFGISMYAVVRAGIVSRAVAEIESLGSIFLEGKDKQEDYINRYGAIFGKKFKKMLKKGRWKKALTKTDRTDYMLPNPLKK